MLPPPINDVTTTPNDPPVFQKIRAKPYPAKNIEIQNQVCPDVKPLKLDQDSKELFERALKTAQNMPRWQIVFVDRNSLHIEAVSFTRLLRYRDDIVIEIRGGTVHMRSKSRLGRRDFGVNAKRIRDYFSELQNKRA